jgi:hypothetical protein
MDIPTQGHTPWDTNILAHTPSQRKEEANLKGEGDG